MSSWHGRGAGRNQVWETGHTQIPVLVDATASPQAVDHLVHRLCHQRDHRCRGHARASLAEVGAGRAALRGPARWAAPAMCRPVRHGPFELAAQRGQVRGHRRLRAEVAGVRPLQGGMGGPRRGTRPAADPRRAVGAGQFSLSPTSSRSALWWSDVQPDHCAAQQGLLRQRGEDRRWGRGGDDRCRRRDRARGSLPLRQSRPRAH